MAWAQAQIVPDSECKLILLVLANRAATHETDSYICWPSIRQLSEECILSPRTIHERLEKLRELGLISWTKRKSQDGGFTSNLFRLPIAPYCAERTTLLRPAHHPTAPDAPPYCAPCTTPTAPGAVETVSKETVSDPANETKSRGRSGKGGERSSSVPGSTTIPEALDTPEFKETWLMWLTHRKQIRKPMNLVSQDLKLKTLSQWGPERAIAAIRHSVENGWQGLFEPKNSAQLPLIARPPHPRNPSGSCL